MADGEKFEGWAIVEIMGHKKLAGFVTEQVIAGSALVRVDVPETSHETHDQTVTRPAYTKLYGVSSIYCITPTTEEIVRLAATSLEQWNDPIPVQLPRMLPRSATITSSEPDDEEPPPFDFNDDDDEGCPVDDPDCEGRSDQCHDACEAPSLTEAGDGPSRMQG